MFIRTTTLLTSRPGEVADYFAWHNFDWIQRAVDPFYESSQILMEPSKQIKLIRKVRYGGQGVT